MSVHRPTQPWTGWVYSRLSSNLHVQAQKIHCLSTLVAHLKCVEGNHHAIKHLDCEMERKVECCAKAAGVEAVICCRCTPASNSRSFLAPPSSAILIRNSLAPSGRARCLL